MIQFIIAVVGAILIILLLAYVENLLGLTDYNIVNDLIVKPLSNFMTNMTEGLSSPFVGLASFFEGILPGAMKPYAWILAVTLIVISVMFAVYFAFKVIRNV